MKCRHCHREIFSVFIDDIVYIHKEDNDAECERVDELSSDQYAEPEEEPGP